MPTALYHAGQFPPEKRLLARHALVSRASEYLGGNRSILISLLIHNEFLVSLLAKSDTQAFFWFIHERQTR